MTPGDQLRIEVDVLAMKSRVGKMEGKAYIDGKLACEATLTCMIVSRQADAAITEPAATTAVVVEAAQ